MSILCLKSVVKEYPGVQALAGVSFELEAGEVHAIMGENGAGKSTLIKTVTGAIKPTRGYVVYQGQTLPSGDPRAIIDLGISAIYQELSLFPELTVAENIFYGNETYKGLFLDKAKMNENALSLLKSLGTDIKPEVQVKTLSIGFQQLVELAKAVSKQCKLLIMDEPTAPLTNQEVKYMYEAVRRLQKQGVTIIYVSHRLNEVFDLCDRVTILRDGHYIETLDIDKVTEDELIRLMVGRTITNEYPKRTHELGDDYLSVRSLNSGLVKDVSFSLKKGEILGLAGLVGAGRTEIARLIFGADPLKSGEITIDGVTKLINSPHDAIAAGIGLLPEDRKTQGALLTMSISDNVSYSSLDRFSSKGILQPKLERASTQEFVSKLNVKTPSIDQLVGNLSGGNQQKVVLAKWLLNDCSVLIFDEPTRGIDVGAKSEIYELMRQITQRGVSVIMISSEMPELLGMSDRVLVVHDGSIVKELHPEEYSQETVLKYASGF
ncbi:sugar ABC transporter ATP-binding protein [Alginatibacterium sediminis]|uniref:Sugar ABC transporter ATP-binding protein n=1 Tax=Alginatibacterium sediminis TaxID=2164068 RepID=A0A420E707_9ALTE|nr:sugar ABC transporter ATP-binding protein [Alginatibacterium sediminis]RKF13708.1 sugar ABC transporter ATP-binding protein [Alginatibacterium sediminis]